MTSKVVEDQLGRNVLTYVDDIIVRSVKREDHISDLRETFNNIRKVGLKLIPDKSVFGITKANFLG